MIIVKDQFQPLVDLQLANPAYPQIQTLVNEYLREHGQTVFHEGKIVHGLPVAGFSDLHAERLARYLNRHLDQALGVVEIKHGYFVAPEIEEHSWLQFDRAILDLAWRQFRNFTALREKIKRELFDYDYLIIDNSANEIYHYYLEQLA
jgi:hypothetical protein